MKLRTAKNTNAAFKSPFLLVDILIFNQGYDIQRYESIMVSGQKLAVACGNNGSKNRTKLQWKWLRQCRRKDNDDNRELS